MLSENKKGRGEQIDARKKQSNVLEPLKCEADWSQQRHQVLRNNFLQEAACECVFVSTTVQGHVVHNNGSESMAELSS